jgi:hypothetical protein
MENLNEANLLNMYIEWIRKYGNRRNENDIRFGQWVWNHYNEQLSEIKNSLTSTDSFLDGFYSESPNTAYTQILKLLRKEYV